MHATLHDKDRREEVALVDQACGERLASELGTANRYVAISGLLETCDRRRVEVALRSCVRALDSV